MYGSPGGAVDLGPLSRFALPHLPSGVTLFFTLSGFLLYRPIVSSILNRQRFPSPRSYFRNRALRILPAYWVILIVTAVVLPAVHVASTGSELQLGRLVGDPSLLFRNFTFTQNYFTDSMDTGIGPAWSLAVEVVFYVVLPFLGLLAAAVARPFGSRRGMTMAALVPPALLLVVSLIAAAVVARLGPSSAPAGILARGFLFHADLFAFGMGLAIVMVNAEDGVWRLPRWWRPANGVVLGGLVLAAVLLVDRGIILRYQGAVPYETLTGLASASLLALVVLPVPGSPSSPLARLLDGRPLVFVGLASYSLFLWHEPLIQWSSDVGLTFNGTAGFWANLAIVALVSVTLATVTYRFVELPALRRKVRSARSPDPGRVRKSAPVFRRPRRA
jgi:peptidoglycan/LPS O-acetylase OafA/YrhL